MMLAESPRSLVTLLALVGCALVPCACTLQTSGLGSADASSAGSGAGGGPTGAGGAGGAGGAASSAEAASVSASTSASAGSGGGLPSDPCGPGSTIEFEDNFDDNKCDMALWVPYADMSVGTFELGDQVTIKTSKSGEKGGYISKDPRSLLGCHVHIEVKQVVNSDDGANAEMYFRLNGGPGQHLEFRQHGSELLLISIIQDNAEPQPLSYSTSTHRWWRFRESSGKIDWDTSANGQDWDTRRSIDTATFGDVTSLRLEFGAIGGDQNTNDAQFDNVNVDPGGI